MMSHSCSHEKVAVPAGTDAHKRRTAFMRAFERAKVGVAIVAAAVAFNTATLNAQDNSDTLDKKKVVEYIDKMVEAAKRAEEAKKKEAEARQKAAELCKKMKEILDNAEKECSITPCTAEVKKKIADGWKSYNTRCVEGLGGNNR